MTKSTKDHKQVQRLKKNLTLGNYLYMCVYYLILYTYIGFCLISKKEEDRYLLQTLTVWISLPSTTQLCFPEVVLIQCGAIQKPRSSTDTVSHSGQQESPLSVNSAKRPWRCRTLEPHALLLTRLDGIGHQCKTHHYFVSLKQKYYHLN